MFHMLMALPMLLACGRVNIAAIAMHTDLARGASRIR